MSNRGAQKDVFVTEGWLEPRVHAFLRINLFPNLTVQGGKCNNKNELSLREKLLECKIRNGKGTDTAVSQQPELH